MIKPTCEYFYSPKKQVINMAPVFKMGLSAQQAMVGRDGLHQVEEFLFQGYYELPLLLILLFMGFEFC